MSELSERFARDGAVVLRNVLTASQVATLRAGIDKISALGRRILTIAK